MSSIIVNLQCLPESFQFEPKWIALSTESRILLGSDTGETVVDQRTATISNGFFPPMMPTSRGGDPIMPLALSASHAEMWVKDNKVMLRDLDAPFGTFVNSVKLAGEMALNSGDIITLGYQLPRNNKTPAHITVDHLKPIIAKVTISVASQS